MLGRHPKTGAPIKIMKSEKSLWKNQKTLVYQKEGPTLSDSHLWKRWDTLIVGCSPALLEWNPYVVILIELNAEVDAWLQTESAKTTRFLVMSSRVIDEIGHDRFESFGLGNVLCLEEFQTMFPYLGAPWDKTAEDAIVCSAIVFRYSRLIGMSPLHPRMQKLKLTSTIRLLETSNPPEPLVLIQQYYKPLQAKRQKELEFCLTKNLENPLIDKIILFMESNTCVLPNDPLNKIMKIPLKTRLTYADCIKAIQTHVPKGHLVAFANTDIYLDSNTFRSIWSINLHSILIALLRYDRLDETSEPKLFGPRNDSQDTWLLHSDSVHDRSWNLDSFKIPFGKAGCDNAILVEFLRNKFLIVNPAFTLKTFHVHTSEIRTYDPKDIVDKPVYMYSDPTGIHELEPVHSWNEWSSEPLPYEPLKRPLKATTPKMLGTFVAQLNREDTFFWSTDSSNEYVPPIGQDRLIDVSGGAFVSPSGLVYQYTKLFVGSTEVQKKVWSENAVSHLMPAQPCDLMLALPLEDQWIEQPSLYTLQYLSRVLLLKQKEPLASFWCKQSNHLLPAFNMFNWKTPGGHLLHYGSQTQAFANRVVGRTAAGVRLQPSEINALRTSLRVPWIPMGDMQHPQLVIVVDSVHLKDSLVNDIQTLAEASGFAVRIIWISADATKWLETLLGATHIILSTSEKHLKIAAWPWLWMAPRNAEILELQEDREPSDQLLHLAAAGSQSWTLLQYPRSTPEGFKKIIMKEITKWVRLFSSSSTMSEPEILEPVLPCIITPPKSMKFGFFGHKGDSFREMIDLWAEKGYIQRKEDPSVTSCWLNSVGDILLYDRPTWEWLERVGNNELEFKKCLTGNPAPVGKHTHPWIFWPRQPRLVETLVNQGIPSKGYSERVESLVFYGRIENDKQGQYRQSIDEWKALCSQFSMPLGAKEAYIFEPEDYLKALANSKFGLCLRGYGPKCNREIELLAMGTVPILMEGVDYTNYYEPLIQNVHVFVVKNAKEAADLMNTISPEIWQKMSDAGKEWWRRNSSIEGSWSRTKSMI